MNRRLLLIMTLPAWFVAVASGADQFTVTTVKGKVTFMTAKGQRLPIEVSDLVGKATVINIPFHGTLELLDQVDNKKYVIKAPGRAPVSVLLKDDRNSVENLTRQYVQTLLKSVTGSGAVMSRVVTEPAAITRKQAKVKEGGFGMSLDIDESLDMDMDLDLSFSKEDLINEYRTFRTECLKTYANFVRETWQLYTGVPPQTIPEVKEVPPMFIPVDPDGQEGEPVSYDQALANGLKPQVATAEATTDSWLSYLGNVMKSYAKKIKGKIKKDKKLGVEKVHNEAVQEKPKPVKAIAPVSPVPGGEGCHTVFSFTVFGSNCQVRLGDECRFTLRGVTEDALADAIDNLRGKKYDNLLFDCLKLRREKQLSDWAYFQMLQALTSKFCGKGTNEATLLLASLYSQSGYKLRLGREGNRLLLLVASQHTIYNKGAFILDGERFYVFDTDVSSMYISRASFPNETGMSLLIPAAQKFDYAQSQPRTIQSAGYPGFKVCVHTNKNLLAFYDTYLSSSINDEMMTRWAMVANTPMAEDVRRELYPQLHAYVDGLPQEEGVHCLLNLIQTGLVYEYDEKVWGHDRAFFPEESLFYPYCDCEDRSILLSRLVRDILGLKVILIYYPGHLALAVRFTDDVKGDCIEVNGEKFIVCDPTYIAADPGVTMKGMDNKQARVILLE